MSGEQISSPALQFDDAGLPYSTTYADHYFSRAGGLDESRHVFLHGNDLPQRWQTREHFVIGETGFGTGLNLLATWQCWDTQAGLCRRLHYIAVEKHPLNRTELQQALALWPELEIYTHRLLAVYPAQVAGFHRLHPAPGLTLTLLFGDVSAMLPLLQARVDAWYLDGFAPARNPAMWQPEVFRLLAQLAAPGATLSTFTVAGMVRRGLAEVGFTVEKSPGFGHKREMLRARLAKPSARLALKKPWLALPEFALNASPNGQQATIIGAGLAGCAIANALACRGWQVTVLERDAGPAQQASGNPAGLVMPRLSAVRDASNDFYLHGYLYVLREFKRLQAQGHNLRWQPCGVVQCAADAADCNRMERALQAYDLPAAVARLLNPTELSDVAGIPLPYHGVWFPGGGWLEPRSLCQAWLQQAGITTRYNTPVQRLEYADGQWQVFDQNGLLSQSPVLILANGLAATQFADLDWLPLWAYRGQTSAVQPTTSTRDLRVALCGPVYLTPRIALAGDTVADDALIHSEHVIGATFQAYERDPALRSEDDQDNLQRLQHWLPDLVTADASVRSLFANVRAATPGRVPVVGPAPDAAMFETQYAELFRHGKPARYYPSAQHQPGLYMLTGLGSRGIVGAPLAAEYLASLVSGEPLPLPRNVIDILNPMRFLVQQMKARQ